MKNKYLSLYLAVLFLLNLNSAVAFEIVEDGIKSGNRFYPVKFDEQLKSELDKNYPDIIDNLIYSESLSSKEKQFFLEIIPIMKPEQLSKLNDVLQQERIQLEELSKKYQQEVQKLTNKFMKKGRELSPEEHEELNEKTKKKVKQKN